MRDTRYLRIPEAARYLGMSETFLYNHWRRFGGVKIGRSVRIDRVHLDRILGGKRDDDLLWQEIPGQEGQEQEPGEAVVRRLHSVRDSASEMVPDEGGSASVGTRNAGRIAEWNPEDPDRHRL